MFVNMYYEVGMMPMDPMGTMGSLNMNPNSGLSLHSMAHSLSHLPQHTQAQTQVQAQAQSQPAPPPSSHLNAQITHLDMRQTQVQYPTVNSYQMQTSMTAPQSHAPLIPPIQMQTSAPYQPQTQTIEPRQTDSSLHEV